MQSLLCGCFALGFELDQFLRAGPSCIIGSIEEADAVRIEPEAEQEIRKGLIELRKGLIEVLHPHQRLQQTIGLVRQVREKWGERLKQGRGMRER